MTTPQEPTGTSTPEQHTDWWGDLISEERQAELDALAERQRLWAEQPAETRGNSPLNEVTWGNSPLGRALNEVTRIDIPLKMIPLTGAEIFWLALRALAGPEGDEATLVRICRVCC